MQNCTDRVFSTDPIICLNKSFLRNFLSARQDFTATTFVFLIKPPALNVITWLGNITKRSQRIRLIDKRHFILYPEVARHRQCLMLECSLTGGMILPERIHWRNTLLRERDTN